jgi:hypothetical protein
MRLAMWLTGLFSTAVMMATWAGPGVAPPNSTRTKSEPGEQIMELEGRIVGLPEEQPRIGHASSPSHQTHVYGFKTQDGSVYSLVRTKYSEALFVEPRLRKEELVLKGTVNPGTHSFDVSRIHSRRGGVLYDVYYYCDVCHIETVAPGICECCQGPVKLVEKPLQR